MEQIVDYIVDLYEFEVVPCSIPASEFQYIKRNFYLWVKDNISEKLFYFLRDKVSPIKFLNERPDGSIWLRKRMSDGKLCEIEIKTIPYFNYSIRIDNGYLYVHNIDEIQLEKLDSILIDKHLCQSKELKQFLRNKKIENILNN